MNTAVRTIVFVFAIMAGVVGIAGGIFMMADDHNVLGLAPLGVGVGFLTCACLWYFHPENYKFNSHQDGTAKIPSRA